MVGKFEVPALAHPDADGLVELDDSVVGSDRKSGENAGDVLAVGSELGFAVGKNECCSSDGFSQAMTHSP